ncbi:MAG: GNAT family N-acetyltransferase [Ruminococcaceae bacterium]|nr:GNAT family N-acetyltransferase [Oscillospiraceae bacterium]
MLIRSAEKQDIADVAAVYADVHSAEESGAVTIGWKRDVYPTRATAEASLGRGDLFVMEEAGEIIGAAIINQVQVDVYSGAAWRYPAPEEQVCVLHTLVIAPRLGRKGYGKAFVAFYEDYARAHGCLCLRMDTNERNTNARALYRKLGYEEIGIVPCVFNGLKDVRLVLLEKYLG